MDKLALTFILLSALGAAFAIVSIIIAILMLKNRPTLKAAVIFFSVIAIGLFIGTLVNGIIGGKRMYVSWDYVSHHPCTWVALGLGIGAVSVGFIVFLAALIGMLIKPKKPVNQDGTSRLNDSIYQEPLAEQVKHFLTSSKKVVLLTASSNVGMGLWTTICVYFAAIFGVESKNRTKKMNRAMNDVKRKLIDQMNQLPEYEFSDFRVVKEVGLVYTGSVIGKLKK